MNKYLKTHDHTYYFAISSGERKQNKSKDREILQHPAKLLSKASGFDVNVKQNIGFRNSNKKPARRNWKNPLTLFESFCIFLKVTMNPLNFSNSIQRDFGYSLNMNIKMMSNAQSFSKNNVCSHDFVMRDWIDDFDYILPRIATEFPKYSMAYTDKH